jgi:hypothetical protein
MYVQELPQNFTILYLLKKVCCCDAQLRLRLNCNVTHNWSRVLKMGDEGVPPNVLMTIS